MSALYARLQGFGEAGVPMQRERTVQGNRSVEATVETWEGGVTVELLKDGSFTVSIGSKSGIKRPVMEGNINERSGPGLSIKQGVVHRCGHDLADE